jgi:hypothetical protein
MEASPMTTKLKRKTVPAGSQVSQEMIEGMIYFVRGHKVMFDSDLASLYGVETKQLKRAVRRNIARFPEDFMFEITSSEYNSSRCQFGTLKRGANIKYLPYVFTEQGVAMLSSVLKSERAIQVNIDIMRTFTRLKRMILLHKNLKEKIDRMEKNYDAQFQVVFRALRELLEPLERPKGKLGF